MVMEAATLNSPQRKYSVVPVQKSLSLPSYARAGGEGIDHRLIFAALEQKEKGRRKSKLFTREKKSTRQNIFCLPIPSSRHDKCRETSLSSDTSCSSLEYQKPKKHDSKQTEKSKTTTDLNDSIKTIQPETKQTFGEEVLAQSVQSEVKSSLRVADPRRSPVDTTLRLNVGSSDSMERSSRSSSDSFSRKERLVAIKARVEAAREKYGESSSEEESRSVMTRYNSDGSIHRSVREVKSRSSRSERRLRRRSQDEWSIKKTLRKNNLNLSLNTEGNDIQLSLERPTRAYDDVGHLDIKTDFCPSPNFPDLMKKNYFSDFPSRENSARFVQARIRHIEDEERKRRSGSDFREKIRTPPRQSPQNLENTSPASTERKHHFEKQNGSVNSFSEKNSSSIDLAMRSSPLPRTSQAPTPPPRSPKSMTFMNKAFIQHQNASLLSKENSLDKKFFFRPNIPAVSYTEILEQFNSKSEAPSGNAKYSAEAINSSEKQKVREMISNRRKTCGNFDFVDQNILNDLCSLRGSFNPSNSIVTANKSFKSVMQIKGTDGKGYFSNSETQCAPSEEDLRGKLWKSKWQENEQRREFMFNSLESKKSNPPSWMKWRNPTNTEPCLCRLFPDRDLTCICKGELTENNIMTDISSAKHDTFNLANPKNVSTPSFKNAPNRLCKSEVNIASKEQDRSSSSGVNTNPPFLGQTCENAPTGISDFKFVDSDKISATANLESAMQELESVYRSLKISSDNLSDRNSASNVSLSDDGTQCSKPKNNDCSVKDYTDFKRRSSVCEGYLKSEVTKMTFDISRPGKETSTKSSARSTPCYSIPASNNKISDVNQLSIDELFNNMTLQLDDLEQNLMKNPVDHRSQQSKGNYQPNRFDNSGRTNNQSPQISIRKEFYDNLSKNSQSQSRNHTPIVHTNDICDTNVCLNKKKYKAVRSLSQNISNLMTAADTDTMIHKNAVTKIGETNSSTVHTTILDQPSPKYYERVPFDPLTAASKRDIAFKQSSMFAKMDGDTSQNSKRDEIRHIRVSMDSNLCQAKPTVTNSIPDSRQYPRLSTAVSSSQVSSKSEVSLGNHVQEITPPISCIPNESVDVAGLEKLLNSLLGEVPERQQSSLLKSPTTPPPVSSGKFEDVKLNRTILPLKMDVYVASKPKNKVSSSEGPLRNIKPEENAQKVNNFRQNNNASVNQMSFIPVYTKKTDMCHTFSRGVKEEKNPCRQVNSPEPTKTSGFMHSPPLRQKVLPDQNEKAPVKTWSNMHMRRRSVGFEDMTSVASRYGYNLSSDQRNQTENMNCNAEAGPIILPRNTTNSENDKSLPFRTKLESENGCISRINQNAQLTENENNHTSRMGKPSQYLKDKSSKRKSSLNRMDFVDFPTCTGNIQFEKTSLQRNSSSDEGSDSKSQQTKSEFLSTNSKRKHNINSSQSLPKAADRKLNEVPPQIHSTVSKGRSNLLPRTLQKNQMKLRQHRRIHSSASHLQKFSHSAGELESLTDPSETAGISTKICLSAQEFDTNECSRKNSKTVEAQISKKYSRAYFPVKSSSHIVSSLKKNSENSSPYTPPSNSNFSHLPENPDWEICSLENGIGSEGCPPLENNLNKCDTTKDAKPVLESLEFIGTLDLKHIDSRSEEDSEMVQSMTKMGGLDISCDNEIYISAEENVDITGSDVERRRGSILRKKSFEEKRELHGILKPPSEENPSRTPPSILKHRESSEEKEPWPQGDLHSILKKSTSEEESCNSGSDIIRPILKVSTDEESPGGGGGSSTRPRPILKKRTSFSEECFYTSYPSGELKPILKKKITTLAFEEQPRPILKSRRKSEDTKSTLSEFVASRPRAYSADMGVKSSNHETSFEGLELNREDPGRSEDHGS